MADAGDEKFLSSITLEGNRIAIRDARVNDVIKDFIDVRKEIAKITEPAYSINSIHDALISVLGVLTGDMTTEQQRKIAQIPEPEPNAVSLKDTLVRLMAVLRGNAVPVAPIETKTLSYVTDGSAIIVHIESGEMLTADMDSWIDGQSQMSFIRLATGAEVDTNIRLVGESEWPVDTEFMAVCTKRNSTVYVNPVVNTEA